jgi:hypothetical protein
VADPVFYVAAPFGDRTGGPEALALLVASMRQRGVESYLIPMHNFRGKSVHPEYDTYDYAVTDQMKPSENSHLVLTEVSPIESYRELRSTPDSHVWMLWLSVNNSPIPEAKYYQAGSTCCSFFPSGYPDSAELERDIAHRWWPHDTAPLVGRATAVREAWRNGGKNPRRIAVETVSIEFARKTVARDIHFGTQSFYGKGFIRNHLGRDSFMLTDYPRQLRVGPQVKDPNLVVYNGAKGKWKIDDLRRRLPEVTFQPLENLSFQQVCEALSRASLYVELGHLPGRDRLPREAALYGTPTVLLARGAGYCWEDFPLGVKYRIPYTVDWADYMSPVISDVLRDPIEILSTQSEFRNWVEDEPRRYHESLDAWLSQVHRGQ